MTPRPRSFDEDVALSRAKDIFWQKGFEATSMQNLVDHMQIGRQSLYNTFGDKHTLYMRALKLYDETSHDEALGRLTDESAGLDAIKSFMGDIVIGLSNQDDRRACFMINAILELAPRDEEVRAVGVNFRNKLVAALERALSRARLRGEVPESVNPSRKAKSLAHTAMGMSVTWKAGGSPDDLRLIIDEALASLDVSAVQEA
jgi:TetR/AcrR family transcriptional repressor of nem operon